MIVTRYLASEIIKTTLGVTLVLLLIGLSNDFVVQLSKAVAGEFPVNIVFETVFTSIPSLLVILLPLGFFLGILLGYGRLFAESEMTVLLACRFSYAKMIRIALIPAVGLMAVMFALQIGLIPYSLTLQADRIAKAQSSLFLQAITPGKFQKMQGNQAILYIEKLSKDKKSAESVFLAEAPSGKKHSQWRLTTGEQAHRWVDPESNNEYVVIENGHRYQGNPGQKNYTLIDFQKYGIRLNLQKMDPTIDLTAVPTRDLFNGTSLSEQVEKHWRLSMSLCMLVIVFLAVPLSVVKPRQGRFANLLPALLMIMLYTNALVINRSWLSAGKIPIEFGFWWVHCVFLMVGLLLVAWRSGWFWQRRPK